MKRILPLVALLGLAALARGQTPVGLEEAVKLALASDETVQQARETVTAAEAQVAAARSGRLPTLDLAGEYAANLKKPVMFLPPAFAAGFGGANKIEMGGDYELAGALTARVNVWTAGRLSSAEGTARGYLDAARYRETAVRDYVRYAATAAYFDVLLARAELANAGLALAETEEAARLARLGLDQGSVSRFDGLRAEVEVANHRPRVVLARNRADLALLALARVCGAAVTPADTLAPAPPAAPVETLLERMRASSPELKALAAMVVARERQVGLEEAGRGPVVQLSGNYALQGQWDDDLMPGSGETAGSSQVALAVQVPIFDGLRAKAGIDGARAELRIARLEQSRVLQDRELAVRQAALSLQNALAALDGARETVRLAQETYRLATVRLESGVGTPLERLDAELALSTARAHLASALHASNLARAALALAVGDGGTAS
ncbi:MAG: TolC family protein [bacterium]|nr:TolC family protein [bacterium]